MRKPFLKERAIHPKPKNLLPLFLVPLAAGFLLPACQQNPGPSSPGPTVVVLVTPTPSVSHPFLGLFGGAGSLLGQLNTPEGAAEDGNGHLYVSDLNNNRVQRFTNEGLFNQTLGVGGAGSGEGQMAPQGVGVDSSGNLWVVDTGNSRLQELYAGLDGAVTTNWITIGGPAAGSAPGAFYLPTDVAFDPSGNLWVVEFSNHRVQELPAGKSATVTADWITIGGTASGTSPGSFTNPTGIAADRNGGIWVAEYGNNRLQHLPAGQAATAAGNWVTYGGTASGTVPGQFSHPDRMTVDSFGNLYVSDYGNNRVQELPAGKDASVSGNWIVIGGPGTAPGKFTGPTGLAADSLGDLYVVDTGNNRIEAFGP